MKHIAIFASGTGSNAKKIIEHFRGHDQIAVSLVVSNKATAPVLKIAEENGIPTHVLNRKDFYENQTMLKIFNQYSIDFVVLAGFLILMPTYLVKAYEGRMVNIHPALLPKYGGKGMYGMNVHEAVKQAGDRVTGITIHYINEHYDQGDIVFQATCPVELDDSPEDIAKKIHALEHEHFPKVIEKLIVNC
ncbi:MAG: phosphoribosylglycinamide formyltransferase [Bacteroidota bacterium]